MLRRRAIRGPRTRSENTVQQRDATLPGGDLDQNVLAGYAAVALALILDPSGGFFSDAARPCQRPAPLCLLFIHPPAHGSEVGPAARNTLDSARIPRASKLLICGLFQKGRVLAQDGMPRSRVETWIQAPGRTWTRTC